MRKRNLTLTISNENHMKRVSGLLKMSVSLSAIISALIEALQQSQSPSARPRPRPTAYQNRDSLTSHTNPVSEIASKITEIRSDRHTRCGAFTVIYVSRARKQRAPVKL